MIDLPKPDFLFSLADAAARETMAVFRTKMAIDNKLALSFDPVTEADRAAERAIRALIGAAYPTHALLGEEYGAVGDGPFCWVIDPIDGTRAFISGVPVWGTLIGLTVDGVARIGIMHQPFTSERFWADGEAAWSDGPGGTARLAVRPTRALEAATMFTTSPRAFRGEMKDRFEALEAKTRLTRFGIDCYAFAMLAAGHADLVVEAGLKPYDIVAMIPIIEQAGGVISTFDGGRAEAGGDIVAASTPELLAAALAVLNG